MARKYAAIMSLIGMLVVLLRALKNNDSFDAAISSALIWMTLLGFVGMVIGSVAEMTIIESVRLRLENELAQREQQALERRQAEAMSAEATLS